MFQEAKKLPASVPLPIPENKLKDIVSLCKDWVLLHGITMRSKVNFSEDVLQISPFILIPTGFPREEFVSVVELQTTLQELLFKISNDEDFIKNCYKDIVDADEYSFKLFEIYEQVLKEGSVQKISMMHLRSDYLMQSGLNNKLKQVEFNTISASFASLSTLMTQYNRFILQELGYHEKLKNIPDNMALTGLAQGLIDAWKLYQNPSASILFLVENKVYNISDQRLIEYEIKRLNPNIKIIRKTFLDIHEKGSLNSSKELIVDDLPVALVYFRDGYAPSNFPSVKEWQTKLMIERSAAIKCPDIKYLLIGQKKVQQELTKKGVLEKYLTETKKINAVRNVFMGMYGLEFDENGDKAVQMALDTPEKFVLKPQREGGGYNIYGNDIKELIMKIKDSKERTSYILMERIFPPVSSGYMIVPGNNNLPTLVDLVSELGIYGILISDTEKMIVNKQVGHMIRSKQSTANEGGVLAGAGGLDCPYLF